MVRAWNAEGHMVVAQIAYNHLDPAVKARCDALIAAPLEYQSSKSSTFVTAAPWADDFKSQLGTAIWHYIDLPFSLDGTSTSGVSTASFDIVRAIRQCVSTLQDPDAGQTNLAISLRYLIHFAGDIEQPLHCSTAVSASSPAGDSGGNGFSLHGTWSNLHSLWDAGGGFLTDSLSRPLDTSSQSKLDAKVALIETAHPYQPQTGVIPDPMDWAVEGWLLAQSVCYSGVTKGATPSAAYLNSATNTTIQQMAEGGQRLAGLLNTIFAVQPFSLSVLAPAQGQFGFSWSAVPGQIYRIQWKAHLDDPDWTDLTDVGAVTNSMSWSETAAEASRFYRVIISN
ncbi:MAG TPA: S1/P1 nuclease [Verrucomicrobiae bacterium]|nr:S1/P1 nuclease [Verrucomicrobiae bacterium]